MISRVDLTFVEKIDSREKVLGRQGEFNPLYISNFFVLVYLDLFFDRNVWYDMEMWVRNKNLSTVCVLLWSIAIAGKLCLSIGGDTLSRGQSLTGRQTIVSNNGNFELGFFQAGTSQNNCLGIRYKNSGENAIVWVANRETPLYRINSLELKICPNGDLGLFDDSYIVWTTNLMSNLPSTVEAVLLDSGNLLLRDASKPDVIFWQSFDHPTDTWLPGSKFGKTQRLISWKNEYDPSPGKFSVGISSNSTIELFIEWNMSIRYWRSGAWNGTVFGSVPELSYPANFSLVSNEIETYYTYNLSNNAVFSRLVITASGIFRQISTMPSPSKWDSNFGQPKNQRDVFALCGEFGYYSDYASNPCSCVEGFAPILGGLGPNDWPGGCSRITPMPCEKSMPPKSKDYVFHAIPNMKFPFNPKVYPAQNVDSCMSSCLHNCSCTAYAFNDSGCFIWDGALYDLQQLKDHSNEPFYLKLALSQDKGGKRKMWTVIVAVLTALLLASGGLASWFYARRIKQKGNEDSADLVFLSHFAYNDNPTDDGSKLRRKIKDIDFPLLSYASVSAATNNFSSDNKLGEGGFGPVYKGKLKTGQNIALKRLSKRSGQGLEEFQNEIKLIAKLQHRNLVRLVGCCIEQDESILIYEYMANKSLDFFLFDANKQEMLDWATRVRIIEGIAQGLLYLHEYSRLRIIHRDLKASNILLDREMNPKISDFGLARIFGDDDIQTNTKRIVGTYGYMSPEYALHGLFSIKSDVFSFGVLVLEIISGKKSTGFDHPGSLNLLGHVWELWISNRGEEVMDPALGSSPVDAVLRYINVGLLCVQENPNDRPNMSCVVTMLGNEILPLPPPKQPAFSVMINSTSSVNSATNDSANGLTFSTIDPR